MTDKGGNGYDHDGDFEEGLYEDPEPWELDPEDLLEDALLPVDRPPSSQNESFLVEKPSKKSFFPAILFSLAATASSAISWNSRAFEDTWIGNPRRVFSAGEWWRLLTSILLHQDIKHLLSNLIFLIPFGGLLTNYFGAWAFPVLGLALGVLTQYLSLRTYPASAQLLGASGLLYVLFGLWLALYFRAETRLKWTNKLLRVVGFGLVMFIPEQFQPEVSYRTHAIGLALGLAGGCFYGIIWARRKRTA